MNSQVSYSIFSPEDEIHAPFLLGFIFHFIQTSELVRKSQTSSLSLVAAPSCITRGVLFLVPVALCLSCIIIKFSMIPTAYFCLQTLTKYLRELWSISSKEKILAWNTQWPILVVKTGGATLFFQTFATSHNFNRMGLLFSLEQQLM